MAIIDKLESLKIKILDYELSGLELSVVELLTEVQQILSMSSQKDLQAFNEVLQDIEVALAGKDYGLLYDLLHFEVAPLLNKLH